MQGVSLDIALDHLDSVLRTRIALNAPGRIFVRAGVVGCGGGALLLPGGSFTGKTTLVAALVRAGAVYYSDEFALLDDDGLIHPYPSHAERFGGIAGDEPVPIRAVVATTYRPGTEWAPRALSTADGALALLGNAVTALYRPAEAMQVITQRRRGRRPSRRATAAKPNRSRRFSSPSSKPEPPDHARRRAAGRPAAGRRALAATAISH